MENKIRPTIEIGRKYSVDHPIESYLGQQVTNLTLVHIFTEGIEPSYETVLEYYFNGDHHSMFNNSRNATEAMKACKFDRLVFEKSNGKHVIFPKNGIFTFIPEPIICDIKPIKNYDIWSEGYRCTGQSDKAHFHGSHAGTSFKEACDLFAAKERDFRNYYDPERMTYWGCSLFDNHTDAAKSFG